ncbi:MAG: alpha/beta hydrolase [Acidimicrobiales bacterium]
MPVRCRRELGEPGPTGHPPLTHRRWPRRAGIGLLAAAVTAWFSLNAYAATKIARGGVDLRQMPDPGSVGLAFENVTYGDGLPAWYVPGDPGRPVIVVVHGYGGNRTATVEVGPPLRRLGYGLLFVDLGYVSGARRYGGGQREADEVGDAVRWVDQNPRVPAVLLGFSGGAFASLAAVARGTRPAAIVADSGFLGFRSVLAFRAHVPYVVTSLLPVLYPLVSGGGHALDVRRALDGRRFDVPAFIIHGTGDRTIPPSDGLRLAQLTNGRLWTLPGVAHTKAFDTDRAVYVASIDEFVRSVVPG